MRYSKIPAGEYVPTADQRIWLNLSWTGFERFLRLKGDTAGPRLAYLDGVLELMSPSKDHERIKSVIGRLVETYAEETGIRIMPYGSWTLKQRFAKSGAEPDECFIIGPDQSKMAPDLAIEVVWTHGGLDKLEIYGRLGIAEVWIWVTGKIQVHVLREGRYERSQRSALLPGLDVELLTTFLDYDDLLEAKREFRRKLAAPKPMPRRKRRA